MNRLIIEDRYFSRICLECGDIISSNKQYCSSCIKIRKKIQWKVAKQKERDQKKMEKYNNVELVK